MNKLRTISLFLSFGLLAACNSGEKKSRGPIVLGDPSTIVTEQDTLFLTDFVDDIDIKPILVDTAGPLRDTTAAIQDTAKPAEPAIAQPEQPTMPAAPAADPGDGLHVNFKEVQVFLPGIETRELKKQNPQRSNGVSYQLTDGNIRTNKLVISGATVTRVLQKYITTVIAKNEAGTLNLETLGSTSAWKPLPLKDGGYVITGLEQNKLQSRNISQAAIRAAVSRAAKRKKLSRQAIVKWEQSVRNVRSVNQRPLTIYLRSVIWKIEGKDGRGRPFQKEVRLDMPI